MHILHVNIVLFTLKSLFITIVQQTAGEACNEVDLISLASQEVHKGFHLHKAFSWAIVW